MKGGWLLTAVLAATLSSFLFAAPPADRPNLLLMFMDDQRYDAMSCAGHPFLKTPNMDRLASEGAYCKNAFVVIPCAARAGPAFRPASTPTPTGSCATTAPG